MPETKIDSEATILTAADLNLLHSSIDEANDKVFNPDLADYTSAE